MRATARRIASRLFTLAALSLCGALLSASLVRFAPGYGVDEHELDPRLSHDSVEAIRQAHSRSLGIAGYYARYVWAVAHGDFGYSEWLGRPIATLIRERMAVTVRSVLQGVLITWIAALALCIAALFSRKSLVDLTATIFSGLLIALPAAVVAISCLYLRWPAAIAVAIVTFPKVFRYVRNLLAHAYEEPYVLAAQARGIGQMRILLHHVFPLASPGLLALLGVSLSLAFGAAIPIEALCDSPGLGQLAWQAALNRDLPLMTSLTLLVTLVTVGTNWLASAATERAL